MPHRAGVCNRRCARVRFSADRPAHQARGWTYPRAARTSEAMFGARRTRLQAKTIGSPWAHFSAVGTLNFVLGNLRRRIMRRSCSNTLTESLTGGPTVAAMTRIGFGHL